jgi:hypothetical protein
MNGGATVFFAICDASRHGAPRQGGWRQITELLR